MVTLQQIKDAEQRIRNSIYDSPFMRSETFSQRTGNSIFLKLENLQMTGSFKERGALNKILLLTDDEKRRGVIAASAGNHAQAVAYHATKRGIAAKICMPLATPLVKVSATREYGATVDTDGGSFAKSVRSRAGPIEGMDANATANASPGRPEAVPVLTQPPRPDRLGATALRRYVRTTRPRRRQARQSCEQRA